MKSPLQVTGIDHVVFHVKDLARARKFYVDFLGMDIDHESTLSGQRPNRHQGIGAARDDGRDSSHRRGGLSHDRNKPRGAKSIYANLSPSCHPRIFNRGSSQSFAWIPAKNMRE